MGAPPQSICAASKCVVRSVWLGYLPIWKPLTIPATLSQYPRPLISGFAQALVSNLSSLLSSTKDESCKLPSGWAKGFPGFLP